MVYILPPLSDLGLTRIQGYSRHTSFPGSQGGCVTYGFYCRAAGWLQESRGVSPPGAHTGQRQGGCPPTYFSRCLWDRIGTDIRMDRIEDWYMNLRMHSHVKE